MASGARALAPRLLQRSSLRTVARPTALTGRVVQRRQYAQASAEAASKSSSSKVQRDPRFSQVTAEDVQFFRDIVGSDSAVIDGVTRDAADDLATFNQDWMNKYRGATRLVLKPGSTAEVSAILRRCNERMLAVVPQGGNTGLVGGSVPVFDEVVVSLSRMNRVRSFDAVSGVLEAEAGVILEAADGYLGERGHLFPLDLGAKGSCQLGGNISTNAGGLRLLRYGSLHGSVLGLEAVLPDGTVVDDLSLLRKNNTGYDLKQLFIGGEGTLGIVTAASVLCPQRPAARNVALFALPSFEHVQRAFRAAKASLAEILSAFEMMDAGSQRIVAHVTGRARPLGGDHPFYCLVETQGSSAEHDQAKLDAFLERVLDDGVVADGAVAQDETQTRAFWSWREGIPETLGHWGGVYKYDVSLPIARMYGLVDAVRERLDAQGLLGEGRPAVDAVGYGHMGDSNLHLNVPTRGYDARVEQALEPFVYEWIAEQRGSISAEHGLGLAKKAFVGYSRSDTMIRLMRQIKDLYDPKGIMNPYKYI